LGVHRKNASTHPSADGSATRSNNDSDAPGDWLSGTKNAPTWTPSRRSTCPGAGQGRPIATNATSASARARATSSSASSTTATPRMFAHPGAFATAAAVSRTFVGSLPLSGSV
jgi:hypothetical protein